MRINTNTAAMNTYSNLTSANASKSSSLAKLSSGLRINKAGDDAAGLAISEKMKNQISGMTQASRNAQDGISLIQTAEGALTETHSMLNRMRDLTVQAGNGTNTADDKAAIQSEIKSLTEEIDRVAGDTEFNTKGLMNGIDTAKLEAEIGTVVNDAEVLADGITTKGDNNLVGLNEAYKSVTGDASDMPAGTEKTVLSDLAKTDSSKFEKIVAEYNSSVETANSDADDNNDMTKIDSSTYKQDVNTSFSFQIGANAGEQISVDIKNMSAAGLGISDINVNTDDQTTDEILGKLDNAISSVSSQRANLGATQNRLDHTVSNLTTTKENLSEANSRIRDVDMAEEMMDFTKSNILSQASTAMLAQANQMPQGVLQLLG